MPRRRLTEYFAAVRLSQQVDVFITSCLPRAERSRHSGAPRNCDACTVWTYWAWVRSECASESGSIGRPGLPLGAICSAANLAGAVVRVRLLGRDRSGVAPVTALRPDLIAFSVSPSAAFRAEAWLVQMSWNRTLRWLPDARCRARPNGTRCCDWPLRRRCAHVAWRRRGVFGVFSAVSTGTEFVRSSRAHDRTAA